MIVVKVGGGKGIPLDAVCQDVSALVQRDERLLLVHGGSHETNVLSTALGKPPRFVTSISRGGKPLYGPRHAGNF